MNNQTAFEIAIEGILVQGGFGSSDGRCVYYSPRSGNRCAVGQLLTPENAEKWQATWRGSIWSVLDNAPRLLADLPSGTDLDFLQALQRFHDGQANRNLVFDREDFITRARDFAAFHDLNTDFLNDLN